LGDLVADGDFTAEDVIERIRLDAKFEELAEAAGVLSDAVSLGCFLRSQRGVMLGDVVLTRSYRHFA
jgi:hypothetical protein